jgi:hypothetical protein
VEANELNPNHQVLRALRNQWPIIAAILIHKFGKSKVRITVEDIANFANSGQSICVKGNPEDIELFFVGIDEGKKIAIQEGGLPV